MPRHDPPPDEAAIREAIRANTPDCTCTPTIRTRPGRRGHTRVTVAHTPDCPAGTMGHRRIHLED